MAADSSNLKKNLKQQENMSSKIPVTLTDMTNTYTIFVSPDEAERLKNDNTFANTLLQAVNNTQYNTNTEFQENIEEAVGPYEVQEEVGVYKWSHEAILLLIEEFRLRQDDFATGKISKKKLWMLIALEMKQHGYTVTGPQCLSKYSGLKRTYKTIKDHNNKSGSGTRTWPYFSLMDSLLGEKPFMSPLSTVSSTGKRPLSPSEQSTSSNSSCIEKEEKVQCKKGRKTLPVEAIIEEFKTERKLAEEASERRHKENLELRNKLLNSFDRMLDILEKQ